MIKTKILSMVSLAAILSACGGSSSVSDTSSLLSWRSGVFEDERNYKNRCESPRAGSDINGAAHGDLPGSKLYEKHWLRSWSNNTYLWYDEITDTDISGIDDPIEYFATLKSNATTESGQSRDRFHYAQNTQEYQQLVSAGATVGYGIRFTLLKSSPPREGRIAYIEPNSPASDAGLSRGAEIIEIDGVDFMHGSDVDTLNSGLFPESAGEQHTFVVRELGQTTTRTVVLKAESVTSEPVKVSRTIQTSSGKVAYLALNTFATVSAESALVDAFTELSAESPNDLVLDLRYNGGGYLAISAQLAYMIAGSGLTSGRTFGKTVFNNKHPAVNPISGDALSNVPFINTTVGFSTTASLPLPSLNLSRIYVISSGSTCSASEALINGLRGADIEVVLIGGTTCGKPYGFYPTDNCGTTYSTIQFRSENAKDFGDYADGFSPNNATGVVGESVVGCQVSEDVLHSLGDEQEVMLKAALEYRSTNSCPPIQASRIEAVDIEGDLKNDPRYIKRKLLEQIKMDHLLLVNQ